MKKKIAEPSAKKIAGHYRAVVADIRRQKKKLGERYLPLYKDLEAAEEFMLRQVKRVEEAKDA